MKASRLVMKKFGQKVFMGNENLEESPMPYFLKDDEPDFLKSANDFLYRLSELLF
jgi:hypothetical protein